MIEDIKNKTIGWKERVDKMNWLSTQSKLKLEKFTDGLKNDWVITDSECNDFYDFIFSSVLINYDGDIENSLNDND